MSRRGRPSSTDGGDDDIAETVLAHYYSHNTEAFFAWCEAARAGDSTD